MNSVAFDTLYPDSIKSQRVSLKLFPPLAYAAPLSSAYAPPLAPCVGLLAPIDCDGISESEEIFLCQPCLVCRPASSSTVHIQHLW